MCLSGEALMTKVDLQTAQFLAAEGEIHLGIGHPSDDLLPKDLLREASQHRLSQTSSAFLQYGADAGDGYFRVRLAQFLTASYGLEVTPETLFISSGISQALDMLCASLSEPGDAILVEEPSYFLAFSIFHDYGLKLIPVPIDAEGLDVGVLETLIKKHNPKLLYTIPTHQNPSGVTLSQARRERLVALAEVHDFYILADEVYHLLSYASSVPKPMARFTGTDRVFSLGSFSKILAPGLRLGWVQAAPEHIHQLTERGVVQSGGGLSPFTSGVVRSVLDLGLQEQYLEQLKKIYKERLEAMDTALRPLPVRYQKPTGGYFFWLELPNGVSAKTLLGVAKKYGVNFQVGTKFSSRSELNNRVRLCFAYYDEADLTKGVERLAKSIKTALAST